MSNLTARIALLAIVPALAAALWLSNKDSRDENRDAKPPVVVATSCDEFKANAAKLFDQGESVALSGTFAPGDHVHLTIDFKGLGYTWELTGALATKEVELTGFNPYSTTYKYTRVTHNKDKSIESIVSRGKISGSARLELDFDVKTAGVGAITISKSSSVPSLISPKVTSAGCTASRTKSIVPSA